MVGVIWDEGITKVSLVVVNGIACEQDIPGMFEVKTVHNVVSSKVVAYIKPIKIDLAPLIGHQGFRREEDGRHSGMGEGPCVS